MRVQRTAAQIVSCFQFVRAQVHWHICTHLHCDSLFQYRDERFSRVIFILHGIVSLVASWLLEHGGACVEWTQLVSHQRNGSGKLIVAGEVRQHRRSEIKGTSSTILVRTHSRGEHRIMEQQVAMFL